MNLVASMPPKTHTLFLWCDGGCAAFGAVFSVCSALVINSSRDAVRFVAADVPFDDRWEVPHSAVWPLAYWVIFNSYVAYACITFGTKYAAAPSCVKLFLFIEKKKKKKKKKMPGCCM